MGAQPRVTILGSVTRDVVRRHGSERRQIGGTVWFAGTTLAGLGLEVRVLTRLAGEDSAIAEALTARGLELRALPAAATTVFHNVYGGDGRDDRRQRVGALAPPIGRSHVEAALEGATLCYLGALHPRDLSAAALEGLRARGIAMAMDVQGFTRRIEGDAVTPAIAPALAGLLGACRVVKASAAEARLITGERARERAARRLAERVPEAELLVTCGPEGVLLIEAGRLHREPARPLDDPDPTGAGDILLAAYLARRLAGAAPRRAIGFAVAHAAMRLAAADRIVALER